MSFGHHLLITTVTHLERCGQYGLLLEESRTEGWSLTKFLASRKAGGWQAPLTHLAGAAGAPQHPPSWGSGQFSGGTQEGTGRVIPVLGLDVHLQAVAT